VEVDASGERIYAVDTGGVSSNRHHIRVIDGVTGEMLFDIGRRGAGDGELNLPRDIAMAPNGDLYVVDGGNFRVQVFQPDGAYAGQMGSIGNRTGQFSRPKGIDTDGNGNVYVSDAAFGNFQIFDANGQLLMFIGNRGTDGGPGRFMLPSGLAVDEDGRVYMVDQYFSKVDVFRPAALAPDEGYLGILSQR
jgi:DNA-binding beta-propeller fold protein YncE